MCAQCKERFSTNPLRILDCKNEECKKITEKAPKIIDYLCEDCSSHFEGVKNLLTVAGVEYYVNPNIVRGLDYYTKTVFEFVSEAIGAQGTVCGGGRYDGLVSQMGGNEVCGIGFGLGIERLLLLMENLNLKIPTDNGTTVYVAPIGDEVYAEAFKLVVSLRKAGISAEINHMNRSVKAQFKYADKINAKYVAVIGQDEVDKRVVNLKHMADGSSEEISFEKLIDKLK